MNNSILTSIKNQLGIAEDCEDFDVEIIIGVNTALNTLTQLGVGPPEGYIIADKSNTWDAFIGNSKRLEFIKTYVFLKTKLVFDPPSNSFAIDSYKAIMSDLEWRGM